MTASEPARAPRGVRLSNPGNIRHSKNKWQGMAPEQPDPDFVSFIAPEWGVRAIVRLLITYESKGCNTVAKIVRRYAPPAENDTAAYINPVASVVGVGPNEVIDVDSYDIMRPLVAAIILHENGQAGLKHVSNAVIEEGLRLGGVHDAPAKPFLSKAGGKVVAGTATALALAGQAAEPVQKAAEGLAPFQGSPIIAQVTMALLTVAGAAVLASTVASWIKHRKGL